MCDIILKQYVAILLMFMNNFWPIGPEDIFMAGSFHNLCSTGAQVALQKNL